MSEKALSQDPNVTLLLKCQILRREGRGGEGREEGREGGEKIPQKLDALRNAGILLIGRLAVGILLCTQLFDDQSIVGCGLIARLTLQEGEIGRLGER